MTKVFSALAVSVDGYITGRDPGAGRGLDVATMLFDWYFDGDTPSQAFDGFQLNEPSARVFDALAHRVGASLAGRNTYDESGWSTGGARTQLPHWSCSAIILSLAGHVPLAAGSPPRTSPSTCRARSSSQPARFLGVARQAPQRRWHDGEPVPSRP